MGWTVSLFYPTLILKTAAFVTCWAVKKWRVARPYTKRRKKVRKSVVKIEKIVHYDTSAMKRFMTSVSLQHEPKARDVITLVKKTFVRTSIVRNFISRGVKMRSDIKNLTLAPVIVRKRTKLSPFRSSVECSHKMEMKYSDNGTLSPLVHCSTDRWTEHNFTTFSVWKYFW